MESQRYTMISKIDPITNRMNQKKFLYWMGITFFSIIGFLSMLMIAINSFFEWIS